MFRFIKQIILDWSAENIFDRMFFVLPLQLQRNIKVSAEECTAEMRSREQEFNAREKELQDKLDKVRMGLIIFRTSIN